LVPWLTFWLRKRLDLTRLRHIFVHTGFALMELTIAIQWSFDAHRGALPAIVWMVAIVALTWSIGALLWVERTPLAGGSAEALARQFRALSLIRLGLAAQPALWGITGSYVVNRPELSWIGTVVSVLLLAWVAPTRSRVDVVEERLRASGSTLSLRTALSDTA
jgi:hypothetical protein